jgi:hypothetical protein
MRRAEDFVGRSRGFLCLCGIALALAGCGRRLDTSYGRVHGASINGTGALAELFRAEGHKVRATVRLSPEVARWADTIVRFAPAPGPPDVREVDWYGDWLSEDDAHRLIYVPCDFDAEAEYWSGVLARLPRGANKQEIARYERRRDEAARWADRLPPPAAGPLPFGGWFVDVSPAGGPAACRRLEGPWAEGIDPAAAALTRHRAPGLPPGARVLLAGDGEALAFEPEESDGEVWPVLVVANGSFLLNEPLVNRARRPLALRVVRWAGPAPRRVVFVESRRPTAGPGRPRMPSPFAMLWVEPIGWIAAHFGAFGLLAALAAAARLGRPRPEPPAGADRPAAHAEALGDLWARTRDADAARDALESYRRWRTASSIPSQRPGGLV